MINVCQHTRPREIACNNCTNPFGRRVINLIHKAEGLFKFNRLTSNISTIIVTPSAPPELVKMCGQFVP